MTLNPTPGHISREKYDPKKYIHPNVHHSTVYNNQDMEATYSPPTEEWIKNMWYIYTTEYYSAIRKNEITPLPATGMEECPTEWNQT